MNPAARAYGHVAKTGLSARQIEEAVARQCASDLARTSGSHDRDPAAFFHALDANMRFWAEIAAAARRPDSPLPPDVRDRIRTIAGFVFARTHQVAQTPSAEALGPLVEINRLLADGLAVQPHARAAQPPVSPRVVPPRS